MLKCTDLLCEYLKNPIGIDETNPRFSWRIESDKINTVESDMNDKQTHYEYKIDILKVAHHGSKYSSTDAFLDYIRPRLSVISCAEKNLYGHPAPDTIDRLTKQNTKIYYTMKSGMITMYLTENKIEIEQYLGER